MKKGALFIIFVYLLCACHTVESSTSDLNEKIGRIENELPVLSARGLLSGETTTLADRMEHYHVPGVSIAVINNFEVEWAKGFGVGDSEENNPVTTDTLFQAASISKPVTAMAVLHYVEQGVLELDEDVNDRMVSWQIPESELTFQQKVTLRRLLSHTAGLNEGSKFGYFQSEETPSLIQVLNGENPAHSPTWQVEDIPGTLWRYSNGGYVTVAQLLTDTVGKPFPEIMNETLFEPLNMSSSTFENPLPDEYRALAASAHGKWGQPIYEKWLVYPEMGAAGLWTTPTDLAILSKEIMRSGQGQSNIVLSKEMVDQMLAPQVENVPFMEPFDSDWGLGWQLVNLGRNTYFVHGGDNPEGFQSIVMGLPEQGWGVVIMTNGVDGNRLYFEILYQIASVYGILPPLRTLAIVGYLVVLILVLLLFWAIAFLLLSIRSRKKENAETSNKKGIVRIYPRVLALLILAAVLISSVAYYLGLEIVTAIAVDPSLETHQSLEALGMIERGNLFAQHGMVKEALVTYADAQNIEPDLNITASDWNRLCWYGSLWGDAENAMVACNNAVKLAPDNAAIKDSRGLARALTGDFSGAIEDFTEYVEWLEKNGGSEYEKNLRLSWISELESGINPFDEAMLMEMR
jgi:CubicO group peptidase (beta-lactamase class C family)